MSTLVEAVSVVIPRHVLDVSYPGGCDAYLEGARRMEGVRFAVADGRLTSVSLATLDEATSFVRPLETIGLRTSDGRAVAIACVDEHFGPTAPASWLRWRRHDEGYTSCWLEWTEPGELARPIGSDGEPPTAPGPLEALEGSPDPAESSAKAEQPDPVESPEASDSPEMLDSLLDQETLDSPDSAVVTEVATIEAVIAAAPPAPVSPAPLPALTEAAIVTTALDAPSSSAAPAAPMLDAIREGLDRQGWRHSLDAAQGAVFYQVPGTRASYPGSALVDETAGLTRVYTHLPVRVPEHRRAEAVELLTRVNHGLAIGNFDFDYRSGEVRFKASAECDGSALSPAAADRLLQVGLDSCDQVHDALMLVIYGGAGAVEVI